MRLSEAGDPGWGRERSAPGDPPAAVAPAAASIASAAGLWLATHTLERLAASSPE